MLAAWVEVCAEERARVDAPPLLVPRALAEPTAAAAAAGPAFSFGGGGVAAPGAGGPGVARRQLYTKTLSQLRALMIARMAKPEEVRWGGWVSTRWVLGGMGVGWGLLGWV